MAGKINIGNHPDIQIDSKVAKIGAALAIMILVMGTVLVVVVIFCD